MYFLHSKYHALPSKLTAVDSVNVINEVAIIWIRTPPMKPEAYNSCQDSKGKDFLFASPFQ